MRNAIIAAILLVIIVLVAGLIVSRVNTNRLANNQTDTQPLNPTPQPTFLAFPTSTSIPQINLPNLGGVVSPRPSQSPSVIYSCQYLTAVPSFGVAPLTVKLTGVGAASSMPDRAYIFDFGEGIPATQTSNTVTHTYAKAGVYHARIEVRDNKGNKVNLGSGECLRTITVTDKPSATSGGTASTLPQTGPESLLLILIAPVAGIGVWLYKRFKLI